MEGFQRRFPSGDSASSGAGFFGVPTFFPLSRPARATILFDPRSEGAHFSSPIVMFAASGGGLPPSWSRSSGSGIGIAGPSVVGGALLLMYKIAMALFVGLGPLFVLSLLFEQTKQLFSRWLYYGIGTMFSLAVLSFTMGVATKVVGALALAFYTQYVLASSSGGSTQGINSAALQQGGVGLIMSTLLITAPYMAASFFGGAIGNFMQNSAFGQVGRNSTGQTPDTVMPVQRQPGGGGGWTPPRNDADVQSGNRTGGFGNANTHRDRPPSNAVS